MTLDGIFDETRRKNGYIVFVLVVGILAMDDIPLEEEEEPEQTYTINNRSAIFLEKHIC